MNIIRFLTFSARKPTHVYETIAYMFARFFLGGLAFVASFAATPAHVAPFLLLSFGVSIVGASAAQTVRSGASRRQEQRRHAGVGDVSLPCEADLRRAAALGSAVASCAPMLALGQALASHAVGALRGWALAAALLSILQSAFDVAWSLVLYPRWRTRYTTERDRLRIVAAVTEHGMGGLPMVEDLRKAWGKRDDIEHTCNEVALRQNEFYGHYGSDVLIYPHTLVARELADGKQIVVPKRRPFGSTTIEFSVSEFHPTLTPEQVATKADATGSSLFVDEEAEKERRHRAWERVFDGMSRIRESKSNGDAIREFARTAEPHPALTPEQQEQAANLASDDPEDAPTTMFSRDRIDDDPTEVDIDSDVYVRCESLDDLLSRTDQPAPVGTRLYVNDDAPIVEYRGSVVGWIVDWLDGATSPASKLYGGRERERFVAMAEGRET